MALESYSVSGVVEVREATGSPGRITGVLLPAGRVAADRKELFVGSGITTPSAGIRLLPEHRSTTSIMEFDPIRDPDGSLRIDHRLPDSPEGRSAAQGIRNGTKARMSIEFHSISSKIVSGVREVRQSLVEAVALVGEGSYSQTRAEVRVKRKRVRSWP